MISTDCIKYHQFYFTGGQVGGKSKTCPALLSGKS